MKRQIIVFLIISLSALAGFSQKPQARQIDTFGTIPCDEYLARMDGAMIEAATKPSVQIYMMVYDGKEKIPVYQRNGIFSRYQTNLPTRGSAKARIESMRGYLKSRNFDLGRVVFINGGFREFFAVEIWSVPPGAEAPQATPTLQKMRFRKGKPLRFCLDCC